MAGNISSDYLFHFTSKFENLLSIIENGFYPNYCLENWLTLDDNLPQIGIPMVCFCDIPEQFIEPHKLKYGQYGIAMEKKWGIEKKITPITYVYRESFNYSALQTIWKIYKENEDCIVRNDFIEDTEIMGIKAKTYKRNGVRNTFENAFNGLFFLFKPYIGSDFSGNDICFYDEKEWRFYPFRVIPAFIPANNYILNENGKYEIDSMMWETYVTNLKKLYSLKFIIEKDINMVFVQNESEKQELINKFGNLLKIKVQNLEVSDTTDVE